LRPWERTKTFDFCASILHGRFNEIVVSEHAGADCTENTPKGRGQRNVPSPYFRRRYRKERKPRDEPPLKSWKRGLAFDPHKITFGSGERRKFKGMATPFTPTCCVRRVCATIIASLAHRAHAAIAQMIASSTVPIFLRAPQEIANLGDEIRGRRGVSAWSEVSSPTLMLNVSNGRRG